MIGRTNAAGSDALNFRIVGGAAKPGSPKENTIWVNTTEKIKSWEFSSVTPTEEEGKLWIETGDTSLVSFNALKKNGIITRPVSAHQCIENEWIAKEWGIWQNDLWTDFGPRLYLYRKGDQCIGITGGWVRKSYGGNPGSVTFGDEHIAFNSTTATVLINPSGFQESIVGDYKTLNAEVEITKITNTSNPYFNIGLVKNYTFTSDVGSQWLEKASATTVGTHTISVSIDEYETGKIMLGAFHVEANLLSAWLE